MPSRSFSDTWLRNLQKKPPARLETYSEPGRKGFMLRHWPGGEMTFVARYQRDGKQRWMTLGTFPAMDLEAAHEAHGEARKVLARGLDPIEERDREKAERETVEKRRSYESGTVGELYHEWFARKIQKERKRPEQVSRYFTSEVLPQWEGRRAREIRKRDVVLLLDEIVDRGAPVAANRLHALLAQLFAWGVNRDLIEASPCVGIEKPGGDEQPKDRNLTDDEIRAFWLGLDAKGTRISLPVRLALRLILVTAQRPGEVAGATWSEIDDKRTAWTIPGERSKNGKPHTVPLSPLAVALLDELEAATAPKKERKRSPFILPSVHVDQKADEALSVRALSRALHNNVDEEAQTLFGCAPFTPHDLRRSAASGMTALGIARLHVSKVLNHSDEGITGKVYDQHDYAKEKRRALITWAEHVAELVAGKARKVVPIARGRRS